MNTVMDAESRALEILDRLSTAIIICDVDLNITMMNPASEMLFGISARQARGRQLSTLTPGSSDVLTLPAQKARSTRQSVTAHDIELELAEGREINVDYTVTPLTDRASLEFLVELVQVDGFLNIARDQNRVDQYAAHRDVLRGLAHEVKNPLGGLRGAAQLLERELSDRGARQYTRIIIHEADRLRNLVDRVIGPNKPVEFRPTNIHAVLEHVRKLILVEVQEGVTIARDYDPSLPPLQGDKDRLIQAVLNIVRNAVQAVQESGSITLRTRAERSVHIGQHWHRCVIRVDIEDNGSGISDNMQERIFYPMVTGRADGSGLGLSIAQDIVNIHHGSIQLHSETGLTRFSLMLPFDDRECSDGL